MENPNDILPSLRELHGVKLYGYSMGYFGIMLMMMLTGSYSYNFYVYTIRLDSILVSVGSTLYMVTMAFSSIIFGVILDNTKPKKIGKRRPYILIGLPIWLVATILIYLPPWIPPINLAIVRTVLYWPSAMWYWGLNIVRAIFGSLLMIVFSSIIPEISQTLINRKKVAELSANLMIISSIIGISFPNIIQSLIDDPRNTGYWTSSGKFIMNVMPVITIIFGILVAVCILISFFSIDESFHLRDTNFKKRSIKNTFKNLFIPVKDKEYMKFMAAGVSTQMSQYVLSFTIIPFIAFVLGRNLFPKQISALYILYIIISNSLKFIWLLIWKIVMDKHQKLLKTYKLNLVFMIFASFLELFFLFELILPLGLILFIFSFGTVIGSMYATPLVSSPLLNEMVDRAAEMHLIQNSQESLNKDQAVTRLSGAYYGLMMFVASMIGAFTSAIFGFIFQGENSENPVILTLGLVSMGFFQIVALVFLRFFKVKFKES
ncbi:MAG: MFS transporter [Candidatus Hodarchaeales archaeon]|jgi:Na+/melibiose symporter-like transporter